jgi:hypothetical protein
MRATVYIFSLQLLCATVLPAQDLAGNAGQSAADAKAKADADAAAAALKTMTANKSACEASALHQPASEYCQYFVVLLSGTEVQKRSALTNIVNPYTDAVQLTNAYSIYKVNLLASEASQKAALNNGQTKQVGSPATGNGSTSLVGKSAATNLLAVAVESGALTQGQTGNTITLQANPADLFREAYLGTPQLSYLPVSSSFLENFTASAGIAANANSTTSVPTTGSATSSTVNATSLLLNSSATKLSSLSVNYEFRKMTQDRVKKYLAKKGLDFVSVDADELTTAANKASDKIKADFEPGAPPSGCDGDSYKRVATLKGSDADRINQFIRTFDDCFSQEVVAAVAAAKRKSKDLDADASDFNQALQADIASFQKKLKDQISGWDLAAQYVFNKPVGQPETHDLRLIGSGDLKKSQGAAWTVNAAASIYETLPSGAKYGRLKDAQFSGEFDKSWGSGSSAPVIGLAGYGQYQSNPSVLNITASSVPSGVTLPTNAQVFLTGTQGWLGVVQAKITLHLGSAQIPLAGKWSNKTDLLDKSKLGAQFGVSYDFSQLKQLIGQGSSSN